MINRFDPPRFAVIPTHNRLDLLVEMIKNMHDEIDCAVIVDNASHPPVTLKDFPDECRAKVHIHYDEEQPPNLYRLWNVAFEIIKTNLKALKWNVAVFNDDCIIPRGWFDVMSYALRNSAGYSAVSGTMAEGWLNHPLVKTQPDGDLRTRMTPWAFMMRGELNLRADESFRWWWGDTDFDWTLRTNGGIMILPGHVVQNSLANSTTHGELMEQAGRDRETFRLKHGWNPW